MSNLDCSISVIMPVYNAELYLREAIDSILNQTFTDFELIIINDGSTDNTESIIKEYTDSRIIYCKNDTNKGLIYTLNRGLELARGKYIARMDADDISKSDRLAKQFHFMEENSDITLLGTAFVYMNTPYEIILPSSNDEIKIKLLKNTAFAHPSVIIRKSNIIEYNLRYNDKYISSEDYKLWTDISNKGLKMANLREVLLEYRRHDGQISTSKQLEQEKTTHTIRIEYIDSFFAEDLSEQEIIDLSNSFAQLSLFSSLALASKLSALNRKKRYFEKRLFDIFLRELMYNSIKEVSPFDFIKILKYVDKLSFVATFFNIYIKSILNNK